MTNTIYVVHGFRSGQKGVTRYFKAELVARAFAAYLGASFDAVVMLEHNADHEPDHRVPDRADLDAGSPALRFRSEHAQ